MNRQTINVVEHNGSASTGSKKIASPKRKAFAQPRGADDAYREATGDPMQLISKNMAQLWRSLFGYRAVVPLIPQFMGKNEGVDSGGKIGLVRSDFCEYQIHFHCGNCLGEDAYGCV